MPEPLSPGQIAYAAYVAALRPSVVRYLTALYANLGPEEHRAWEAAAQAVLEAFVSSAQPLPHWGEPHVTDGTPCFCGAREEDGVVIHRRMPWEQPGQREGEA